MIRSAAPLPWILLGLAAAGLVLLEPWIQPLVPHVFGPSPFQVLPLLVFAVLLTWLSLRLMMRAADFAALSLGLLLATSQLNGFGLGPLDSFDFVLALVLLAWIARMGLAPERPIRLSFLFFAAGGLLILAFAHMPVMNPVRWLIGLIGVVRIILITFLFVDLLRDRDTVARCLRIFVFVATVSALIGLAQFTLAYTGLFIFTLIDPPVSAFKPTPIGFVMRASGLCSTAQHYSSFLLYALPAALWHFSNGFRLRDALTCLILLAGILVAINFAAIFGAMLVMASFPLLRWPNRMIHILLAGLGLLMLSHFVGMLELLYDMSFGDAGISKGVDQRKTLFQLGLEQISASPWIGTGLDGFGGADGNFWHRPVHNIFGQAAAELGLLGLLLVITIFFVLTLDLGAIYLRGAPHRDAAAIALMMVTAGVLASQAEPNLQQSNFWLVLALAQAVARLGPDTVRSPALPGPENQGPG